MCGEDVLIVGIFGWSIMGVIIPRILLAEPQLKRKQLFPEKVNMKEAMVRGFFGGLGVGLVYFILCLLVYGCPQVKEPPTSNQQIERQENGESR